MSRGYKPWLMVFSYSTAHFIVDFACAFLMFSSISGTPEWYICVLLYNFCAFAMQMPLGALADACNKNFLFAAGGCLLVAAAFGFTHLPYAAAIIAGVGNGMFHIGGGVDVLNISEKKSSALGIFVSPGAFGIYSGTILGRAGSMSAAFVLPALLLAALFIFFSRRAQGGAYPSNAEFSLQSAASGRSVTAAVCLFLVVCLRSYVGLTLQFPWKGIGYWGTALICAVVFGKMAGGFAADRFGLLRTSVISLGAAAALFLLPGIPVAGVLSLLLFNMTMPITLWAMAKIFPGAKGFSFGLLTFGLFVGFLPKYLGVGISAAPWAFALMAVASLILLCVGVRKAGL